MGRPPNKAGCPHPPRGKVPYKPPPPTKAAEAVLGRPVRIGGRQACRCSRMGCPESSKTVKSRRCESESFRKVPSAGTPRIRASPKLSALTAPPKSVRPLPIRASRWPDACPPPTRRRPPSHPAARSPNSAAPRPDQVPGHFAPLHYGQISCVAPQRPPQHSRHASDWPNGPNLRFPQRRIHYAFYLARNIQKRNDPGELCWRINGRRLIKTKTLASHGCHSVERQQGHGVETGVNISRPGNQRLAQAWSVAREARLHLPEAAPRRVCGWLLLARVPMALPDAPRQRTILASKDFTKCRERPRNNPPFAPDGLACD